MLSPCPDYGDIFYSYHGTSPEIAKEIASGKIDVTLGGGELGRGFYTGQFRHEAKAWSFHTTGAKEKNVVVFTQDNIYDFLAFRINRILDDKEAQFIRNKIKGRGEQRNYVFNYDIITSKIIGCTDVKGCQLKWESSYVEDYLNGSDVGKCII